MSSYRDSRVCARKNRTAWFLPFGAVLLQDFEIVFEAGQAAEREAIVAVHERLDGLIRRQRAVRVKIPIEQEVR
jgi:hypothetical protein